MKLERQRVVIIGGSSGIGAGIAEACLAEGAAVTLVGRSAERLRAAAARLGPNVSIAQADATREDDVERLFEDGPVNHVVITAVQACYAPVRSLDLDAARSALLGKVLPALLVAKHARFAAGGSLLLTSGINALRPTPGASAVAAGNGAVEALGRTLAVELAPTRVLVLAPGWVDTPVWDVIAGDSKAQRFAAHAAKLPVGRVGTPADLGAAAVFLLTNGYMTGTIVRIDGGHPLV
jgi:NAD(P)-dependent dehydrogenase (short-subunit alcohol dehydrogenase family)